MKIKQIELLLAGLASLLSFSASMIYMFSGDDWIWPLLTFVWATHSFFSTMENFKLENTEIQ